MAKPRTRYQIFVSSTYIDLVEERQAAVEAILRAGHIPAGMELFAAENKPQMDAIKDWIGESDIFCLILGGRYGSIEPESGKSYVECEYDYAVAQGKPVFSLVLRDDLVDGKVQKMGRKALEQENQAALKVFRGRITDTLVRMVDTADSIKVAIFEALSTLERKYDIEGWVRAKDAGMQPQVGEELARLSAENAKLSKELAAATAKRDALIDGRDFREWANLLAGLSISGWDPTTDRARSDAQMDLFTALMRYGHHLGAGVTNSANSTALDGWLFGLASALTSFGLAESLKTPPKVYWQRQGLSATGKRLYAAALANRVSKAAVITSSELVAGFRSALTEAKGGNGTPVQQAAAKQVPAAQAPAHSRSVTSADDQKVAKKTARKPPRK